MRRLKLWTASLALVAVTAWPACATTFLDVGFGTPADAATSRGLALGSSGVALLHGTDALLTNPAGLAIPGPRGRIDLTLGLTQASEDRLVPLFDSFESFVDETAISLNRNTYGVAQGGVMWRIPSVAPVTLGIGIYDRFDFDYDYFEEFRDPDSFSSPRDRIVENRTLGFEGRLRSVTAGSGVEVARNVRLGLSVHRYFGDVGVVRSTDRTDPSAADSVQRITQKLEGWGFTTGVHMSPNERVDLGVGFEGQFEVEGVRTSVLAVSGAPDSLASGLERFEYPATLRFGVAYHPRNPLRTVFTAELARRFWERLEGPSVTGFGATVETLRDTWDFHIGLEHVFYNGLPVRFGFRYLENSADPESERSIFSLGVGYRAAGFEIDVTGLLHRQTSRQGFHFDPSFTSDGRTFPAPESDAKVEDTVIQLVLGASRTF